MAHPTQLLKDLEKAMPEAAVQHWVYGLFNTTRTGTAGSVKGLLAAGKSQIIFWPASGASAFMEKHEEIESVTAHFSGTISIVCQLKDGCYVEMSYISRGDPKEFIEYMKRNCGKPSENPMA